LSICGKSSKRRFIDLHYGGVTKFSQLSLWWSCRHNCYTLKSFYKLGSIGLLKKIILPFTLLHHIANSSKLIYFNNSCWIPFKWQLILPKHKLEKLIFVFLIVNSLLLFFAPDPLWDHHLKVHTLSKPNVSNCALVYKTAFSFYWSW
jgi:hypothetical protein